VASLGGGGGSNGVGGGGRQRQAAMILRARRIKVCNSLINWKSIGTVAVKY